MVEHSLRRKETPTKIDKVSLTSGNKAWCGFVEAHVCLWNACEKNLTKTRLNEQHVTKWIIHILLVPKFDSDGEIAIIPPKTRKEMLKVNREISKEI